MEVPGIMLRNGWNRAQLLALAARVLKFSLSGIVGFAVFEVILIVGLQFYGIAKILSIDIIAFILGTTASFLSNEAWTFRGTNREEGRTASARVLRLAYFQIVSLGGNTIVIACQIALLLYLGIPAYIGTAFGGALSLPLNYRLSTILVWRDVRRTIMSPTK
ncbi:MAG: GtrA family protein [Thermoplasmata archaeon YP2-bin.285]|uniref:GtrA family protein n=1 Tax=Candidatus Sysuiplasma superficiale TaxID=2823368 RepID=A0A8J8CAQ3_9ARCH|nr:GtrA family protein [Candidatus Sysuiplasma superficiale]